jgi:flavin-dependent dehydrogenase
VAVTIRERYDTIVVGGRCAGAATAMLLARAGQRVLVCDAARPGTDTLSTHALTRGGVLQLHRWGLLDAVAAAGTPAIRHTELHCGDDTETLDVRPLAGTTALYAPRRTVLDPILVDAARAEGAEVRHGVRVTEVLRDRTGRVRGIGARSAKAELHATADLVVGADGHRSTVAAAVRAPLRHAGAAAAGFVYGHWTGLTGPADRYRLYYDHGIAAGVVPTNDDQTCVWIGVPRVRFDAVRNEAHRDGGFGALLAGTAPDLTVELARAHRTGPIRGFPGARGHLRAAAGPGWALVGDAGSFKDPISSRGITDALRDAELLARAVLAGEGLEVYERVRDELSRPVLATADRIASFDWNLPDLRRLLVELHHASRSEIATMIALDPAAAAA